METAVAAVQPPPLRAALPEGVCSSFAYRGKCRFANCRFLHVEVDASLLRPPPQLSTYSSSSSKPSVNRSTRSSEKAKDLQHTEATKDGEEKREGNRSWRSVDFMLQGESVKTNAYLRDFAAAPWLNAVLEAPECSNLLSVRGKSLRKELTEAFGAVEACRRALAKLEKLSGGSKNLENVCFVDLCCGKGFSSLLLSLTFPNSKVLAVDSNPDMELSHFRGRPNLDFRSLDVTSTTAFSVISAALGAEATAHGTLVFLGIHLCGSLSCHAVRLYREASTSAALVLAPCCLDSRVVHVKRLAKRLRVDPHLYWCLTLFFEHLPRLPTQRQELLVDSEVLSAKNTFILAARQGGERTGAGKKQSEEAQDRKED